MTQMVFDEIMVFVDEQIGRLPDFDFDKTHTYRVMTYCERLADERGLDVTLSRCMGALHDMGRVMGLSDGHHSRTGANLAIGRLKGVSVHETRTIVNAILRHSQKHVVSEPYDELLKDADCLAHLEEDAACLKASERIRIAVMDKSPMMFKQGECNEDDLYRVWFDTLRGMALPHDEPSVHEARVLVRNLTACLKLDEANRVIYAENLNPKGLDVLKHLRIYKKAFQILAVPRQLDVFESFLAQFDLHSPSFERMRHKAYRRLAVSWPSYMDLLDGDAFSTALNLSPQRAVSSYFESLSTVDETSLSSLHHLRIKGKMLKFMIEVGLVLCDEDDAAHIEGLHKAIGKLQDLKENRKWLKRFHIQRTAEMRDVMAKLKAEQSTQARNAILYFKLRLRR